MKGADQCPRCASRRWAEVEQPITRFYAGTIRVCANCRTSWEPFDPAQLLDVGNRTASFIEPCGNCAFRPGSPEQADRERWREMTADLRRGAAFYCHKGVPIEPRSEDGFGYPKRPDGKHDVTRLRLCRGYLKMLSAQFRLDEVA